MRAQQGIALSHSNSWASRVLSLFSSIGAHDLAIDQEGCFVVSMGGFSSVYCELLDDVGLIKISVDVARLPKGARATAMRSILREAFVAISANQPGRLSISADDDEILWVGVLPLAIAVHPETRPVTLIEFRSMLEHLLSAARACATRLGAALSPSSGWVPNFC